MPGESTGRHARRPGRFACRRSGASGRATQSRRDDLAAVCRRRDGRLPDRRSLTGPFAGEPWLRAAGGRLRGGHRRRARRLVRGDGALPSPAGPAHPAHRHHSRRGGRRSSRASRTSWRTTGSRPTSSARASRASPRASCCSTGCARPDTSSVSAARCGTSLRGLARVLTEPEVTDFADRALQRQLRELPLDASAGTWVARALESGSAAAAFETAGDLARAAGGARQHLGPARPASPRPRDQAAGRGQDHRGVPAAPQERSQAPGAGRVSGRRRSAERRRARSRSSAAPCGARRRGALGRTPRGGRRGGARDGRAAARGDRREPGGRSAGARHARAAAQRARGAARCPAELPVHV